MTGKKTPVVALLGNPNCGKTTIFNEITGAHQHVGNYPGVTVERIYGKFKSEQGTVKVIDLPGVYRLGGGSPEENIVTDTLSSGEIDVLVNIVDSTNFERHLYLTVQLSHFKLPTILVLNMSDEAKAAGLNFDIALLEKLLGVKIVQTAGSKGVGIKELKKAIAEIAYRREGDSPLMRAFPYGESEEPLFADLTGQIKDILPENRPVCPDSYLAEKIMENDEDIIAKLNADDPAVARVLACADRYRAEIISEHDMPVAVMLADKRYGMISGLKLEAVSVDADKKLVVWTDIIDLVLTNKFLGIPFFLFAMYCVFTLTFVIGDPLVGLFEGFVTQTGEWVGPWLENYPALQSLVVDGIIAGVGGVASFLPPILILFFGIALLETSGYMARAAFVMDRFMHLMGLHGKSFVPMLIGMGCSVPAIMATRSIESRRDRLATIFVIPLMSCAARMPIYTLFIAALIPSAWQSITLWCLYVLGMVLAVIVAKVLKSTVFKGESELFIMELPPYRLPSVKSVLVLLWRRAYMYLKKAGTVILAASIVLWFLNNYPKVDEETLSAIPVAAHEEIDAEATEAGTAEIAFASVEEEQEAPEVTAYKMENSYSGKIGKFFEPVTQYAGMDWRANSGLVAAFAAKEIFVAQLGILFSTVDEDEDDPANLRQKISEHYTMLQGLSIMVFCLIGFPCMASIAATRKETQSWAFTIGNTLFLDVLGFIMAVIVYQTGLFLIS